MHAASSEAVQPVSSPFHLGHVLVNIAWILAKSLRTLIAYRGIILSLWTVAVGKTQSYWLFGEQNKTKLYRTS